MPTATFPEICNGLFFRSMLATCLENVKFVALPIPEIIGNTEKISAAPGYAHAPFSQNFKWAFVRMDPVNVPAKFAVRSFTRSLDNRVPQKFGQSLDMPMLPFVQKF